MKAQPSREPVRRCIDWKWGGILTDWSIFKRASVGGWVIAEQAGLTEPTYIRRPPGADMDRSARLPWHSKGLLKDRFLSMDFTRICRDDGRPAQNKQVHVIQLSHQVCARTWFGLLGDLIVNCADLRLADSQWWTRITDLISFKQRRRAVTHHSGEAGDEFDAVLHLLLSDLHRCAVLFLQRKVVCTILSHPRMQLYPQKYCDSTAPPIHQRHKPYIYADIWSHLDFWDGDSCFWLFIQHPLNELLQVLSYDRPRREITL